MIVLRTTTRSCQRGRNRSIFMNRMSLIKNRGEGGSPRRKKNRASREVLFILKAFMWKILFLNLSRKNLMDKM
jgi:hypothetical protein